jgi:hypothetical protein
MKGITDSGISFGYKISEISEGKGSRGILPRSNEDNGLRE